MTNTTATLAPFGPLRTAWTVDTYCPDCLHAAYTAAINAQDTGETTVTVSHDSHTATATMADQRTTALPYCDQCEDDHPSRITADGAITCAREGDDR